MKVTTTMLLLLVLITIVMNRFNYKNIANCYDTLNKKSEKRKPVVYLIKVISGNLRFDH